jgi:hypothetical protein
MHMQQCILFGIYIFLYMIFPVLCQLMGQAQASVLAGSEQALKITFLAHIIDNLRKSKGYL